MTKRLTGRNALAYVGVEAPTPANTVQSRSNPDSSKYRNFEIGDVWVNTQDQQVWILVDKTTTSGTWIEMASSAGVGASNFETDSGTAVDLAGTINMAGGDLITTDGLVANTVTFSLDNGTDGQVIIGSTAGSPAYANITSTGGTITVSNGPNTLNLEADVSGFAENYPTDSGTAQPMGGDLNIVGDGNLETSASGDTVSIAITNGTNGQLLIGGGSDAQWVNLTSTGGTINITNGANSINIESTVDGANDFVTDSGTATQASNTLNLLGDSNVISTTGSGDTVTVSLDNGTNGQVLIGGGSDPTWANLTSTGGTVTITEGANSINLEASGGGSSGASQFDTDGASANEAAGIITMAGGDLITTSGSGSTVTFDLDNGTDGQLIIGSTAGLPAYANLTSTGGTITISNGSNSINLEASGGGSSGASEFITDAGTANQSAGEIEILGGTNINTSGASNQVTVNVDNSPSFSGSVTAGTGLTVTTGGITSTGTTTLSSLGSGVVQTNGSGVVSSSNGTNGEILIGGGSAPAWANITSGDGSVTITNGTNMIDLSAVASGASTVTTFTSSDTWTKGASTKMVTVLGWSGGGGGASGGRGVEFGGGGGGNGSCFYFSIPASFLGATENVTVGQGGIGGVAVTSNSTSGNDGNPGTVSGFGNIIPWQPSNQGRRAPVTGSGGGSAGIFYNHFSSVTTFVTSVSRRNLYARVGGEVSTTGNARSGGNCGISGTNSIGQPGISMGGINRSSGGIDTYYDFKMFFATGGGGAGHIGNPGGDGGNYLDFDAVNILYPGATGGAAGSNGNDGTDAVISGGIITGGFGGGGGGGESGGVAGIGGNGGFPGGGGGGGGSSSNGTDSGAGGNGGDGLVIVIEW